MPEKNGYEGDQEEFWHPDGSGRKVSREVFERETEARRAAGVAGFAGPIDGAAGQAVNWPQIWPDGSAAPPHPVNNERRIFGGVPAQARRERWISLPLVGFGQRQSALHGQVELFPQFYEADVEVSQIVGISQVAETEFQRHGAMSDVFLRFGGKVYCTLTRQQLRQRLGIVVEEVPS